MITFFLYILDNFFKKFERQASVMYNLNLQIDQDVELN